MQSYAIVGTGAIGGYCAIKLNQAGFNIHCLLNSDYLFVKEHGLTLLAENKKITIPVNAYKNVEEMPKCDVIVVALKATANTILKNILPKLMHPHSILVFVQNGIGVEEEIAEFIQPEKIIGSSCSLKVSKISPGVIQYFGFDSIDLAQYYLDPQQSGISESVIHLAKNFKASGINSTPNAHLPTLRWKKLVANIPASGVSILFNVSTREMIENPEIYQLVLRITKEVIDTARRCGANIPENYFEYRLSAFEKLRKLPINYMSMKEDFDANKPIELQTIYGNAINIAKKHNIDMPLTEKLYQELLIAVKNKQFQ